MMTMIQRQRWLLVLLLLLLVVSPCICRRRKTKSTKNEKAPPQKSWFESWDEYLHPSSNDGLLHSARQRVEQEISKSKHGIQTGLGRGVGQVETGVKTVGRGVKTIGREVIDGKDAVVDGVHKHVFRQRVGWDRFRHSVRDGFGFVVGVALAFVGYSNSYLRDGGVGLTVSQFAWQASSPTIRLPHEPWLRDVLAFGFGMVTWKWSKPTVLSLWMAPALFSLAAFETMTDLSDDFFHGMRDPPVMIVSIVATFLVIAITMANEVPLTMACASTSGAKFMVDSVVAEIAGNWVYLLEATVRAIPALARAAWIMLRLLQKLWGPIRWLVRMIRYILRLLTSWIPKPIKKWIRKAIFRIGSILWRCYRWFLRYKAKVQDSPMARPLQRFLKRLKYTMKRNKLVMLPWGVAWCGVSRQMGWVKSPTDVLVLVISTLNPLLLLNKFLHAFQSKSIENLKLKIRRLVERLRKSKAKEE